MNRSARAESAAPAAMGVTWRAVPTRSSTRKPLASLLGLALALSLPALACSGTGGKRGAVDHTNTLEAELAGIPPSSDYQVTLRRSEILRSLGKQTEALAELETAADAGRERLDWVALTSVWREVGDIYLELGRPQDALETYGKRLKTAVALEKQVERGRALVDTAYAFALMGVASRAQEALSDAQTLAGAELKADPLTVERMVLARELLQDPEIADQIELLGEASQRYRSQGDSSGAARAAVYRARLETRRTQTWTALDGIDDVVAQSRDPEPRARLLRFQAEAAFHERSFVRCENLAKEAVKLADNRGLQPVAKLARVVLARCASEAGHLDVAITAAEEAGFLIDEQRKYLTGEQARQDAGFDAFLLYRLLLSLQARLPEDRRAKEAFVTTERARARAHLDAVARSQVNTTSHVSEVSSLMSRNKEEAEEQVRRLTQELTAHRGQPHLAERHRNALWALEDIKETIRQQNPLLSRISVPEPATIAQVREKMLDAETLLISYFVGEDQVIAIAVDKGTERLALLDTKPEELGKVVRAFRRSMLLNPDQDLARVREAAQDLHRRLLKPFEDLIKARKNLLIIPHGALSSLPFEALADSAGKYLVEGHDVSYSLSATLGLELARLTRPTEARKGFVGIGDPVYDWAAFKSAQKEGSSPAASRGLTLWIDATQIAQGPGAGKSSPGLERLPGTATELKAIAKLFGQDQRIYLREQASEENVKAGALANYRIVHIASHGILEPHYQALALSLNPDAKEDGFVLHSEIVDLKLSADLVVLSACQTGNTRQRSAEPVAGLALALRTAGAHRVVVSLWSVDDDATARLMTDFYRPLVKEGASYGAALSEAKRQMITKGPAHPYYWAPFVLIGN